MTKARLMAELKRFPDDAPIIIFEEDGGRYEAITGVYRIDERKEAPRCIVPVIEIRVKR